MPLAQAVTFTNVAGVIAPTAAGQVATQLALFKTLIPDPAAGRSALHTDFDEINPDTAIRLRALFTSLAAAIAAAPTV